MQFLFAHEQKIAFASTFLRSQFQFLFLSIRSDQLWHRRSRGRCPPPPPPSSGGCCGSRWPLTPLLPPPPPRRRPSSLTSSCAKTRRPPTVVPPSSSIGFQVTFRSSFGMIAMFLCFISFVPFVSFFVSLFCSGIGSVL